MVAMAIDNARMCESKLRMDHKRLKMLPFPEELPLGFVCQAPQLPSSLSSPSSTVPIMVATEVTTESIRKSPKEIDG